MRGDLARHLAVAADAIGFQHLGVAGLDADGFIKILKREGLGMVIAIGGLHEILVRHVVVGQMAVVAGGLGVVRGVLPAVELLAHDVAVHADRRIVGHVGIALGVHEREQARTGESAQGQGGQKRHRRAAAGAEDDLDPCIRPDPTGLHPDSEAIQELSHAGLQIQEGLRTEFQNGLLQMIRTSDRLRKGRPHSSPIRLRGSYG